MTAAARIKLCLVLFLSCTGTAGAATSHLPEQCIAQEQYGQDSVSVLYDSLTATQADSSMPDHESGAYNPLLLPGLIQQGLEAQKNNQHAEAVEIFNHALQVFKSDKGLYHPGQIHLLQLLIKSRLQLYDWEKVTDHIDHEYWLLGRNYSGDDPAVLPLLKQVRRWHMEAYNRDTGRSLEEHFEISDQIYKQAMTVIRSCGGSERQAYCFWHRACCPDAVEDYGICPLDRELEEQ